MWPIGSLYATQADDATMLNLRAVLAHPRVYSVFSSVFGADRARKQLVKRHIRPRAGDHVLDIGCGPADILAHLPGVHYVGFDSSEQYIAHAQRRWANIGTFTCGSVTETTVEPGSFDIVLAFGVIHHLTDDEAIHLFRIASSALRPGGRLITVDGAYVDGQSPLARYLLSKDRGQYVRAPQQYETLARTAFGDIKSTLYHNMSFPIPYTHLIMECSGDRVAG